MKKPNVLGKDLFMFQLDSTGHLIPMGLPGTTYSDQSTDYCSKTSNNSLNGASCGYKILQNSL